MDDLKLKYANYTAKRPSNDLLFNKIQERWFCCGLDTLSNETKFCANINITCLEAILSRESYLSTWPVVLVFVMSIAALMVLFCFETCERNLCCCQRNNPR